MLSTDNDVHDSENHHPHGIDEVPVPGDHLDVLRIASSHDATKAQPKNQSKQSQSGNDVCRMQSDQRVEGRAEKISRDSEVVLVNQPSPFESRPAQEHHGQ